MKTASHGFSSVTLVTIAAHCNTLQHTARHCKTLQHTATYIQRDFGMNKNSVRHSSQLRHTAAHCSTLQHTATFIQRDFDMNEDSVTWFHWADTRHNRGTLRHTAAYCSTLHVMRCNTAAHCSTPQHTATHYTCNALQCAAICKQEHRPWQERASEGVREWGQCKEVCARWHSSQSWQEFGATHCKTLQQITKKNKSDLNKSEDGVGRCKLSDTRRNRGKNLVQFFLVWGHVPQHPVIKIKKYDAVLRKKTYMAKETIKNTKRGISRSNIRIE